MNESSGFTLIAFQIHRTRYENMLLNNVYLTVVVIVFFIEIGNY